MLRLLIALVCSLTLFVSGCVKTQSSSPQVSGKSSNLSSAQDPDGDGDAKGYNYFPMTRPATGGKIFIIDLNHGAWAAYNAQGQRVNVGRASGGQSYCADVGRGCRTQVGSFKIIRKGSASCASSIYPIETGGGAPMPYCMFFSSKGYAVHGSNHVPDYNASHGCVRVTPTAAAWLSKNFMQVGTTVIVLPYSN